MITVNIDRDEIVRLTEEYGGEWGINHTRRLLQLIAIIGEGQTYDADVIWMAAHLHDWGGYSPWMQKGVDHAIRSKQVAETFLTQHDLPADFKALVLECIESHHYAGSDRSVEALLLRDADALDFLGVVGAIRDFAKAPKDLRAAYQTSLKRRATLPDFLYFERAKGIAAERIKRMDEMLAAFDQETFGYF